MLAILPDWASTLGAIDEQTMRYLIAAGGLLIALAVVIGGLIRSVLIARAREHSRREIAAYVAEGSMSADDGAKLIGAGQSAAEPDKAHRAVRGCCGAG